MRKGVWCSSPAFLFDVHLAVYSFSLPSYIHSAVLPFKYLLFSPKVHIGKSTGYPAPRGLVDIMKICGWDEEWWEEYDGVGKMGIAVS